MKLYACFLIFLAVALPLAAQMPRPTPPDAFVVDASLPIAPPETGYLRLGGTSSNGHSLQVNSRYLVLDGKPWLPVMGELHYTRVAPEDWEDEILKMKAGGVNIISTYVFWIHHEEIEGEFDWSGQRDLRRFVQLCAKHGMYVWLRPGPWAHGEVRNGGFPDWLNKMPGTRTNDPDYIRDVERFFDQIGTQVNGLMFKDGGPIIGAQLENEYSLHGPGRGAEHILKLKQLAIAAGIDPPLFSVTGWPSLDFPPRDVLPVSGGYPDGFWYGSQNKLPPSITYLFNFNRELGDMGATVRSKDPTGAVDLKHDPYFAAEEAGGMAEAYHRRPVMAADDIAALTLTGIGSGMNLYGYYMFHGGTNPHGKLTTLQESQATGFPNDLPEYTYDFGAPLGEAGQERESYRKTRMLHLFLNAYGPELAPMSAFAPAQHSRDPEDASAARVAVRSNGTSGFLFVNNYVRQLDMPERKSFQASVKLSSGEILVPAKPVAIPANSYFAWPINLAVGRTTLRYATAQVLTRLDTPAGPLIVLFALPGVAPELCFDGKTLGSVSAPGSKIVRTKEAVTVTNLRPGRNTVIQVTSASGERARVLLMTEAEAEETSLLKMGGKDYLAMTSSSLLFDDVRIRLRSTQSPTQQIATLPALRTKDASAKSDGLWTTYTLSQPAKMLPLTVKQTQTAVPRAEMTMGPYVDWRNTAVPTVPPDAAFTQASVWNLQWKRPSMTGLSDVLLRVDYTGDVGRLYARKTVLDDNFFNGLPWEVEVGHLKLPADSPSLALEVLPMPKVAPIYLDPAARGLLKSAAGAQLLRATLVPEYESTLTLY